MRRKELEIILSSLRGFARPKEYLEQWMTPPEIAASLVWEAYISGDIEGKVVADLGAGTGILGIAAAILGASKVYLVEVDREALAVAQQNIDTVRELIRGEIVLVNSDVRNFSESVDTVVMNPPWGLERGRKHADRLFVERAMSIARVVYALLHMSEEAIEFWRGFALRRGFTCEVLAEVKFPLPAVFHHHRRPVRYVRACLMKFSRRGA